MSNSIGALSSKHTIFFLKSILLTYENIILEFAKFTKLNKSTLICSKLYTPKIAAGNIPVYTNSGLGVINVILSPLIGCIPNFFNNKICECPPPISTNFFSAIENLSSLWISNIVIVDSKIIRISHIK